MKTIIALTDFSLNANHAAHYAMRLAMDLKTNLLLCNAYLAPTEIPSPYTISWPVEEYEMLSKESSDMLESLRDQLITSVKALKKDNDFVPRITTDSSFGNLCSVVEFAASSNDIALVVAGVHDKDSFSTFLQGNNMKNAINNIASPLLLVPPAAVFHDIKRIAFATDLTSPKDDIAALQSLNDLIEPLNNTEILLTTINDQEGHVILKEHFMKEVLDSIALKNDLHLLTTKVLRSHNVKDGLAKICADEAIDLLMMVHHHFGFIKRLIKGSHTLEMTKNINIPLLILNSPMD